MKLDDRKFQGEDILVEDILAKAGVMQGDPVEIYSTTLSSVEGRKETVETVETLWTDVM